MNSEVREELIKWHRDNYNQVFDNDYELKAYCASDVTILRAACVKFKNLVKSATTLEGVEAPPINVFVDSTIAGSAMSIFKQLLLCEVHKVTLLDNTVFNATLKGGVWRRISDNKQIHPDFILKTEFIKSNVPLPPARGYNNSESRHSAKSIIWLEYVAMKTSSKILHARNGGEKRILNYYLDGFDEDRGEYINSVDRAVCYTNGKI